jgi:hypothetical protein
MLTLRASLGSSKPPVLLVAGALLPGVKWPVGEAEYSPLSRAEVKNY